MRFIKKLFVSFLCVMLLTGCWDSKEKFDVTEKVNVEFNGYNREGSAWCYALKKDFEEYSNEYYLVQETKYDLDRYERLSNGDVITLSAEVDPALEKLYQLKAINLKKEIVVEGLKDAYLYYSDFSKKDMSTLEKAANHILEYKIKQYPTLPSGYEVSITSNTLVGQYYEFVSGKGKMTYIFHCISDFKEEDSFSYKERDKAESYKDRYFIVTIKNLYPENPVSESVTYNEYDFKQYVKEDLSEQDICNLVKRDLNNPQTVFEKKNK